MLSYIYFLSIMYMPSHNLTELHIYDILYLLKDFRLRGDSMVSEAQKRATKNYEKEKIDKVTLRLEKGKKEIYRIEAEKRNISLNAFIVEAIEEKIKNQ